MKKSNASKMLKEQLKASQEAQKAQEARMEQIVVTAREKILPYLEDKDLTYKETKMLLESLAMTLQQGAFKIMKDYTVKKLGLINEINDNFPGKDNWIGMIKLIEKMSLLEAAETLQWMNEKVEATLKDQNNPKKFTELGIKF
jgi:hypothetical protein